MATPTTAKTIEETPAAPSRSVDLRLLHAASQQRSGGWLADALVGEGIERSAIESVAGVAATLARLREQSFDVVVVSHEPGMPGGPGLDGLGLDGPGLVEGLRVAGQDAAVVVLVDHPDSGVETLCHEAGADVVCPVAHATARSLVAAIRRAVRWRGVLRENRQLQQNEQQRLAAEHRDAEQTLADQRRLIDQLVSLASNESDTEVPTPGDLARQPTAETHDLPPEFDGHYHDLLRAYVVMGAGNLAAEIDHLAELLAAAGVTAERVIQLHLVAVERLLAGLGRRGVRHVMNRADLLVLELVAKLADGYHRRYHERTEPPRQLTLPGFAAMHESPTTVRVSLNDPTVDGLTVDEPTLAAVRAA